MDVDAENTLQGLASNEGSSVEGVQLTKPPGYNENQALIMAVTDWIPELYKTKTSSGQMRLLPIEHQEPGSTSADLDQSHPSGSGNDATMEMSKSHRGLKSDDSCSVLLTVEDLLLICHMFYLPYEHGPRACVLLQSASWLLSHTPPPFPLLSHAAANSHSPSSDEDEEMTYEWYHRAGQFHRFYRDIAVVVDKLVNIPNRELLYEIYAYITDMRSTLALVNSYIKWHGAERKTKNCEFKSGDQEPWVYRGGLLGEFRTLLPLDSRLMAKTAAASRQRPFIIRPYYPSDKASVYAVCEKAFKSVHPPSNKYRQLLTDWYVGGLIECSSTQCYVLEGDNSLVYGYAIYSFDAAQYYSYLVDSWVPTLTARYPCTDLEKKEQDLVDVLHGTLPSLPSQVSSAYPSMLAIGVVPTFSTVSALETLVTCAFRAALEQKSLGLHVLLPPGSDLGVFLSHTLGLADITRMWPELADGWTLIGKRLTPSAASSS